MVQRDRPWIFRTYAGHSSAVASNRLYRDNLAKGQTGLSVAFDLPTQVGLDADHILARGEVGRVGVPVSHMGDMGALFDGIPLDGTNTSMTINATAPWLMALYVATAEAAGASRADLTGTTQNDIAKEYLSRGTYVFAPAASLSLQTDLIAWATVEVPRWNPINVCSYHLQEAGATPVQELAFALANAIAVIERVREGGQVPADLMPSVVGRISFFVNAGMKIITETCKLRAFTRLWDDIAGNRFAVTDPKLRRFRYGVQVNSLGLTEQQPENNLSRILLEMLAVTLSKDARARAVQLPAWNEALGLPRPWDQQVSLRMQQILAYETDLLEFGDILNGNPEIERVTADLIERTTAEIARIEAAGGLVAEIENGSLKRALVASHDARRRAIESGDETVVGVNRFTSATPSPLTEGQSSVMTVDPREETAAIERLEAWRASRDTAAVTGALTRLAEAARDGSNIMEPSIAAARAGVTTGEWRAALEGVFGTWRAPTGVTLSTAEPAPDTPRLLVGKPGLDGHSNGAEQVALRAEETGFAVTYDGIRQTPAEIATRAESLDVDIVGLSILSGAHLDLARAVQAEMRARNLGHVPIVVGGIVPQADADRLRDEGIAAVFTPADYDLTAVCSGMLSIVQERRRGRNWTPRVAGGRTAGADVS